MDGRAAVLFVPLSAVQKGSRVRNLLWLVLAIVLELCGDASVRVRVRRRKPPLFFLGAVLLISYGTLVSFPNWTFSRTMGVYIAIFFIISQVVAVLALREQIKMPAVVGGVLIVSGGLVILFWNKS